MRPDTKRRRRRPQRRRRGARRLGARGWQDVEIHPAIGLVGQFAVAFAQVLVLTGIVNDGARLVARFEDSESGEGVFVRAGESLRGLLVKDVNAGALTFVKDGELRA